MKNLVLDIGSSKKLYEAGLSWKSKYFWLRPHNNLNEEKELPYEVVEDWCAKEWFEEGYTYPRVIPTYLLEELLSIVEGQVKDLESVEDKWTFTCQTQKKENKTFTDSDPKRAIAMGILWQKEI